ncbi:MAG TPA: GAF domain-containing sensor histidine kinase [bacterium]|nr:GAF domain-containing sensor histidine kinase [bacterium]
MVDPRIPKYIESLALMQKGNFQVEIPVGEQDEIGSLGLGLRTLGETLKREFDEINVMTRITEQINAGLTLEEVLNLVYDSFRSLLPYDRIGFSLIEPDGENATAVWARSDGTEMHITKGYSAPLRGSSLAEIIRTGKPRILNDLEQYLREHPESESTRKVLKEGIRSSLTCPLIAKGKPVGFLFFSSKQLNAYRDAHVESFLGIAGQLALIVEKGRLYERLVALNEIKNRFLGIAAHDLRNPIAGILGYTSILEKGLLGALPDQQMKIVGRIGSICTRMQKMVEDLLDVSAIESGNLDLKREWIALDAFLQEQFETARMLAQVKNIEMRMEIPSDLPRIFVDSGRLAQVISNLVTNAIKFSQSGTVVTLLARVENGEALIAIKDQGPGIPKDELGNLFRDFGRTSVKPTDGEKSTGLGLAIVKRLVEAHGGRIWVESQVGAGSTFVFALPLQSEHTDSGTTR